MKTLAPLTKTQYGLYVECANHSGEAFYNIPYCYTLDGSLDGEKLRCAIETAVKAHATLFTRIVLSDDGEPQQQIDNSEIESWQLNIETCSDIFYEFRTTINFESV